MILITFPFHSGRLLDLSSCEYSNGRNHLKWLRYQPHAKLEWEEVALPLDLRKWQMTTTMGGLFYHFLYSVEESSHQFCTKTHQPWPLPFPTTNKLSHEPNQGCHVLFSPHARGIRCFTACIDSITYQMWTKIQSAQWVHNSTPHINLGETLKIPLGVLFSPHTQYRADIS